jgi:hypothetical protein
MKRYAKSLVFELAVLSESQKDADATFYVAAQRMGREGADATGEGMCQLCTEITPRRIVSDLWGDHGSDSIEIHMDEGTRWVNLADPASRLFLSGNALYDVVAILDEKTVKAIPIQAVISLR